MTPAAIAAICGFLYSPPASYDAIPLPPGAQVVEVPAERLDALCAAAPHQPAGRRVGCFVGRIAFVPTWKTWHGTRDCWIENRRHEEAHLKDWRHP